MEWAWQSFESIREGASESTPRIQVDEAIEGLKFSECLPVSLAEEMLRERLLDAPAVLLVLSEAVKSLANDDTEARGSIL